MAKILVVDDEAPMRKLLKEVLIQDNHEVREAENGMQASAMFRSEPADLVITDIRMPDTNGIDLIVQLRRDYPRSRIIAISGGGGGDGRVDYLAVARQAGATQVISKPFQIAALRLAVGEALSG
ncbi:MAG: response regulator [Betaproteobacteria bacterium]|nr:response regulator [Betaproteobacteria bacterium]